MKNPQSGQLLIAPPRIPDPRFRGAVILLTQAGLEGSIGYCLNRTTNFTLQDIIAEAGVDTNLNFPLYWGGPLSQNTVWMLHSDDWSLSHTHHFAEGWGLTSHISMFQALANNDIPREFRMFVGHCGWTAGQLECELLGKQGWNPAHSWLVTDCPGPDWVMGQPVDLLWETATTLCSHQAVDSWL